MEPLQFLLPVGRLDPYADIVSYVALGLVVANMGTRWLAHQRHVEQANAPDGTVERYWPHVVTSVLLVVASFAFLVVEPHGGMVLSVLAVTTVVADLFEFEARQVEARNEMPVERPKSALTASLLLLLYAGFQSLFVFVQPFWQAVV